MTIGNLLLRKLKGFRILHDSKKKKKKKKKKKTAYMGAFKHEGVPWIGSDCVSYYFHWHLHGYIGLFICSISLSIIHMKRQQLDYHTYLRTSA